MVKSGPLKTVGEATETSVDIAVAEINAKGGIERQEDQADQVRHRFRPQAGCDRRRRNSRRTITRWPSSDRSRQAKPRWHFRSVSASASCRCRTPPQAPASPRNFSYAWRLTADEGKQFNRLIQTLRKARTSRSTRRRSSMSRMSASRTSRARSSTRRSSRPTTSPSASRSPSSTRASTCRRRSPRSLAAQARRGRARRDARQRRQGASRSSPPRLRGPRHRLADLRRSERRSTCSAGMPTAC